MYKRVIGILCALVMLLSLGAPIPCTVEAAAVNDYTQWKQYDSEWNQQQAWPASQYPNATEHWMSGAGCVVTSIAMLLRHYNVVTTSDVNQFNPWICNETLKKAGAFDLAADLSWNLNNAYPGFVYQGMLGYSLSTLTSLYNQGYACLVQVNGSGGYYHYVAVRDVSGSTVTIMDPGSTKTQLSQYSSQYSIIYYKPSGKQDTTAPTISNIKITDLSASGYTVTCTVSDNVGVTSVSFPTWPYPDGSWQPVWHEGTISGNTATCRINVSDHGNIVNTNYATHIYAYDAAGNSGKGQTDWIYVDATTPEISNIKVKNITKTGYDIECKVTNSSGIDRVQFPTWTAAGGQDDIASDWKTSSASAGSINGNTVTFHVDTADHNNETGIYYTHIYAYGKNGTESSIRTEIYLAENDEYGYEPLITKEYSGHKYLLFEGHGSAENDLMTWTEASTYCQSIGGYLTCITSQEENDIIAPMVAEYGASCWIGASDLATEGTFVWESGEDFSYTNWADNEPNDYQGKQDCVVMYRSGEWDDAYSEFKAFICEIPHSHTYTSSVTKKATCTETGVMTYTCNCGYTYTDTIDALGHSYDGMDVPATCKEYAATQYTCSVCGDSYKEYNEVEYSEWSEEYPENADESLIKSKTEYRYQTKETTTSSNSNLSGWTLYNTTSAWSDYGAWSTWSDTAVSASDSRKVETRSVWSYYYFLCPNCGAHMHGYGTCYTWAGGCGATTTVNNGVVVWSTTSWDNAGLADWYGTGKYYAYVDGQLVFKYTDVSNPKTQYRYCTRSLNYTYYYYRWSAWSDWNETVQEATDNKNVETRTVYQYATSPLGDHVYGDWTVVKNPTLSAEGLKERECSICGDIQQETVEKLPLPENPYTDVAETDWFYDVVYYNYVAGYMTGKSQTIFAPEDTLTRAEFASVLHRTDGEPEVEYEAVFSDIAESDWYAAPIIWASQKGVVNGFADGTFGPDKKVTREQMAIMMHNYATAKGYDTTQVGDLSKFEDVEDVSWYAVEAMQWAVGTGVISGKNGISLDPQGNATRAECAAIIQRFMENCTK